MMLRECVKVEDSDDDNRPMQRREVTSRAKKGKNLQGDRYHHLTLNIYTLNQLIKLYKCLLVLFVVYLIEVVL